LESRPRVGFLAFGHSSWVNGSSDYSPFCIFILTEA
jgi:hypothetical protein